MFIHKTKTSILSLVLTLLTQFALLAGAAVHAAVPGSINYQGSLTDNAGNPLTATVILGFKIYAAPTGGEALWGPQTFTGVAVVGGYFNVVLGPTDTTSRQITAALAGTSTAYLEISVDGAEVTPRQQILSAPYAVKSQYSDNATVSNATLALPAGMIVSWMGSNAVPIPTGWLLCDGSPLPPGAAYDALRAVMANTATPGQVPDLRGVFLRGLDSGRGLDTNPGRTLGDYQEEDFETHDHTTYYRWNLMGGGGTHSINNLDDPPGVNGAGTEDTVDSTQTGGAAEGSETRPDNVAVNYLIKY